MFVGCCDAVYCIDRWCFSHDRVSAAIAINAVCLFTTMTETNMLTLSVLQMALGGLYFNQETITSIYNVASHFFANPCPPLIKRIVLDSVSAREYYNSTTSQVEQKRSS